MITSLLFDLDGTLFDSTQANIASYTQAFKETGVAFDAKEYQKLFGLRFQEMMDAIAPSASEETRAKIKELKSKFYKENLSLVRPNNGLIALLRGSRSKFKSALVTTASRQNVLGLLEHFSIAPELFDVIIFGEDVKNGKPDPECYVTAISRLGVAAEDCCVFEDSEVGILAAQQAGLQVIRVSL